MSAKQYMTKGEIRSKLLIRLGYGGLGAAAAGFVPIADDLIEEAYEQCFQELFKDEEMGVWDVDTGINQRWYDIPATLDNDKIDSFAVWYQETWLPMHKGIDMHHDADYDDWNDHPLRWDIRYNDTTSSPQIEIWPKPDAVYPMRIEGQRRLNVLNDDNDRVLYDDRLILLYAIAIGKAHLNRPDAATAMNSFDRRLKRIRGNGHNGHRYIRGDKEPDPLPRPYVTNPDTSTA